MADKPSLSDYRCSICLELLVEPVVMPCKHELCRPCFRHNVEEGNFVCPICRKRIASWARKSKREGTLVNQKRWGLIQKLFPEKCLKRLKGDGDESEDELVVVPKRVLAKSGELREEYENEMNKILEVERKEEKASEELIKNLLEEEKTRQLEKESQQREDEQLAKRIAKKLEEEENIRNDGEGPSRTSCLGSVKASSLGSSQSSRSINKRTNMVANSKRPRAFVNTLDKYLTPKEKVKRFTENESHCSSNKKYSLDDDLALAKTLQKQYDKEAFDFNKREEYMLRKTILSESSVTTNESNNEAL